MPLPVTGERVDQTERDLHLLAPDRPPKGVCQIGILPIECGIPDALGSAPQLGSGSLSERCEINCMRALCLLDFSCFPKLFPSILTNCLQQRHARPPVCSRSAM